MKVIMKYTVCLLMAISLVSCNYLDVVPDQIPTMDNAFSDRYNAEKVLATCYWTLPRSGHWNANPGILGAMEMILNKENQTQYGMRLGLGEDNQSFCTINYWSYKGDGTRNLFAGIRDCNTFLENIEKVQDLNRQEKDRMIAEVKLIKAYHHFYLVRYYGPIPIMKENMSVEASTQGVREYRDKIDDCFTYILQLLDEVIESDALPERIDVVATELGRFIEAAAYAIKAKVLVYWASPFFNGNRDYATFLDHKGEPYFNQQRDQTRWTKAAEACLEAIEICKTTQANIHLYQIEDYQPPKNMSSTTLLVNTLRSAYSERWNPELIWANPAQCFSHQSASLPQLQTGATTVTGLLSVPFSTVDWFYSNHGVPIDEDIEWINSGRYAARFNTSRAGDEEHKYYIYRDGRTADMNFDREPRFYSTLGFDKGLWYGNSVNGFPEDDSQALYPNNLWMQYSSVSGNPSNYNATGYWPKKLVSFLSSFRDVNSVFYGSYAFPEIRYADLLLLTAEALNETVENDNAAPLDEVYTYIDEVRNRAGLDGVKKSWEDWSINKNKPLTKGGMREIIQHERKIELACESHYYWDVRRWQTAPKELNRAIKGWTVTGETENDYYKENVVYFQRFNLRNYLAPIPHEDIINNPNLIQNPGY